MLPLVFYSRVSKQMAFAYFSNRYQSKLSHEPFPKPVAVCTTRIDIPLSHHAVRKVRGFKVWFNRELQNSLARTEAFQKSCAM